MPNWCECHLEVNGPEQQIKLFIAMAGKQEVWNWYKKCKVKAEEKEVLNFYSFDMPSEKDVEGDWYEWQLEHWGVKWGACHAEIVDSDECYIEYGFDAPWTAPIPIIHKMSEWFPTLHFKLLYAETGMCFGGMLEIGEGGVVVVDKVLDLGEYFNKFKDDDDEADEEKWDGLFPYIEETCLKEEK